jgi:uncharacterized protein YceK
MKKVLIVGSFALLTGCSSIMGIVGMQPFDSNEYGYANSVRTQADTMTCTKAETESLNNTAIAFKNYTQYIPYNDKTIAMASDLQKLTDELAKRENPTSVYCKIKLNIISKSAEEIQRVVGSKPR